MSADGQHAKEGQKVTNKRHFPKCLTSICLTSAFLLFLAAGCSHSSQSQQDEQLKRNAAKAAQEAKQAAQDAADKARIAAANAEQKVNAIAAGVQEGLQNGKTAHVVDINSASKEQLSMLPGISPVRAQRIIDNRPYRSPRDLVRKGLISQGEYERISKNVVAQ